MRGRRDQPRCVRACCARVLIAFSGLTGIGGCYSRQPTTIAIRDAVTHQPVPSATVTVRSLELFWPDWPYPRLNPFPPSDPHGVTDRRGVVELDLVQSRAAQLVVTAHGYPITVVDWPPNPTTWAGYPDVFRDESQLSVIADRLEIVLLTEQE